MKKISVIIADDHPIVRVGINQILAKVSDIELVGETTDSASCLKLCDYHQPTVLVLDINMPGKPVTETIAFVKQTSPQTQILILTAYLNSTEVQALVSSGVAGYILKEEATEKVVEAIRTVAKEKTWFSQRVIANLLLPRSTPKTTLTKREHEVLQLVIDGKNNKNIGQTLNISARVVRRDLQNIYNKLEVNTRIEAAVLAVRLKLVEK
ncbi:MAG: response regulator [Ardenticatenaceae bacterium]